MRRRTTWLFLLLPRHGDQERFREIFARDPGWWLIRARIAFHRGRRAWGALRWRALARIAAMGEERGWEEREQEEREWWEGLPGRG